MFRIKYSRIPIILKLVIRNSDYPEAGYPELRLYGSAGLTLHWLIIYTFQIKYSRIPITRKLVIRNSDYPDRLVLLYIG